MKINNFRRLDQEPTFPKWSQAQKSTSAFGQIFGTIVGIFFWLLLIIVFCLTAYLYWFQRSLVIILQAFRPGQYKIPWWFSILVFIFLMPLTLAVILVGTLIEIFKQHG